MDVSIKSQRALIWWALGMLIIFMIAFVFLIRLVPLPPRYAIRQRGRCLLQIE